MITSRLRINEHYDGGDVGRRDRLDSERPLFLILKIDKEIVDSKQKFTEAILRGRRPLQNFQKRIK